MSKIFKTQYDVKLPLANRDSKNEEYWTERKGIIKCSECGNMRFIKKWFADGQNLKNHLGQRRLVVEDLKLCPACRMLKNNLFEGELRVEKVPKKDSFKLRNLINNFGATAISRDPQDRLKVSDISEGYRVISTDNQLVNRLGKKIHNSFRNTTMTQSHGPKPNNVNRVRIVFNTENEEN